MLLIRTDDGGKSWHELSDESRPTLEEGEASFAASGTGIRCLMKNRVVIATGGVVSRLFLSEDKGVHWLALKTPILQGLPTTGIFSVALADNSKAIIAGGNFEKQDLRKAHVYYTIDGGNNWSQPSPATGGYRECVEYVSNDVVLAVGPTGIDISKDGGRSWFPFSAEPGLHTVRKSRNGSLVLFAGNEGKIGIWK
jgi:photosystem II stability/assembly factor-like uncharacterized protein